MNDNKQISCPQCSSTSIDILEDEGVAICTECYLEWPYIRLVSPAPLLTDGASYIIYLKNNRKVFGAIYHHCTLSAKHYFSKGDDIYPIEDVYSHAIKAHITSDEPPQRFRENNYGHQMEIVIENTYPYCKLSEVPDSVYECIFNRLAENITESTFDCEDVGDVINGEMRRFSGFWRVVPTLDFASLLRVAIWVNNYGPDEGLNRELFTETYGSVMGDHYLTKWDSVYRHNIISMVAYFGNDSKDGQRFVDMVMRQTTKYEQRIKAKRNERRT